MRMVLICIIAAGWFVAALVLPAWCGGCASCESIQGVDIDFRDGTASVAPVTGGVDTGPGAPGIGNHRNLPGNGATWNMGEACAPNLKWGVMRLTKDQSDRILVDGEPKPGWSWDCNARALLTPGGYKYIYGTNGMITSASSMNGLRAVSYAYDSSYPTKLSGATDGYGRVYSYGVDVASPGPTYVINPDSTRKITYGYVSTGSNGAGLYTRISIYGKSGGSWAGDAEKWTDYSYNSDHKVTSVATTDYDDQQNPSATNVTYYSTDQGGRTKPVQRVENSKLQVDTLYSYSTENVTTSGGTNTYGVTSVRRRATYGSDTDTADQVTKYYYYRDGNEKDPNPRVDYFAGS